MSFAPQNLSQPNMRIVQVEHACRSRTREACVLCGFERLNLFTCLPPGYARNARRARNAWRARNARRARGQQADAGDRRQADAGNRRTQATGGRRRQADAGDRAVAKHRGYTYGIGAGGCGVVAARRINSLVLYRQTECWVATDVWRRMTGRSQLGWSKTWAGQCPVELNTVDIRWGTVDLSASLPS